MLKRVAIISILLLGSVLVMNGQTSGKTDTRTLLDELGNMLTRIPDTKEECHALLKQIDAWQQRKLKELETPKTTLRITLPHDKDQAPEMLRIEGTVVDPTAKVWLIVHPMEVSDYWVQAGINVKEDGTWRAMIHIGRPGKIDVGKQFEIIAIANPRAKLSEGDVLNGWPEAEWKSQVIEVTRK